VIHRFDLTEERDNVLADKTIICNAFSGLYAPDINNYTCTFSCPIPGYDKTVMKDNWSTPFLQPQYMADVSFECQNNHQLVTWTNFEQDIDIRLTDLTSTCDITGKLTPSIELYTCSKDCNQPELDDTEMEFTWNLTQGLKIATKIE
jgi:hypothetical protein